MSGSDKVPGTKTRVLIVDDTRTIRAMIRVLLHDDDRIEVVGEAADPYEARDLIKALSPDVLTLDVEMPRMNGLVFLEKLMRLRPMPVVMVSTRTAEQSDEAIKALALGAIDCIDLTRLKKRDPRLPDLGDTLVAAGRARLSRLPTIATGNETRPSEASYSWNGKFVLIGSSTGGVDALLVETMSDELLRKAVPVLDQSQQLLDQVGGVTASLVDDVERIDRTVIRATTSVESMVELAEDRVSELNALLEVAVEEAEETFFSTAAIMRALRLGGRSRRRRKVSRAERRRLG